MTDVITTETTVLVIQESTKIVEVESVALTVSETVNQLVTQDETSVVISSAGTQGIQGAVGLGFPTGGTAGQSLQKIDATDYNTQWATIPAGATGATGATGAQGIQGATGATGAAGANGEGVPVGGTAGQVLAKIDGTNYNTEWVAQSGGVSASDAIAFAVAL